MNNNIKEINIYPQIFLYKKSYIDAILFDSGAEIDEIDVGQFFSIIDGVFKTMVMTPHNIIDNNIPEMVIANSSTINPTAVNFDTIITHETIVNYIKSNVLEIGSSLPYTHEDDTSNYYTVVDGIRSGQAAEDYLCLFTSVFNIPIRIRYIYEIITQIGASEYSYWFPTEIGKFYETVIFAYGKYAFTSDTEDDRFYPDIRWDVYDANGEIEDENVGKEIALNDNVSNFPKYIVARLSVLGNSEDSVSQYEGGFTFGDFALVNAANTSGALRQKLSEPWVLYANTQKQNASNPKETEIQYKAMSCYRKYIAFKIDSAFGDEKEVTLRYFDDNVGIPVEEVTINCDMKAVTASPDENVVAFSSTTTIWPSVTISNASAEIIDTATIDVQAVELTVFHGLGTSTNVTIDEPITIATTIRHNVPTRENRTFAIRVGNMNDILTKINLELSTPLVLEGIVAISVEAKLKTTSINESPEINWVNYSENFMILSGANKDNGLLSFSSPGIAANMNGQKWNSTYIQFMIFGLKTFDGRTIEKNIPLKFGQIKFTNNAGNSTSALNNSANPASLPTGSDVYPTIGVVGLYVTSEIQSVPVPVITPSNSGNGMYSILVRDSFGYYEIHTESGTINVPDIFVMSKEPDGSELDGYIEASMAVPDSNE